MVCRDLQSIVPLTIVQLLWVEEQWPNTEQLRQIGDKKATTFAPVSQIEKLRVNPVRESMNKAQANIGRSLMLEPL